MDDRGESLGGLVRFFRLSAGLTQEELAERAQLSVRMLGDLERGRTARPRRQSIELVAAALGLLAADRATLFDVANRSGLADEPEPAAGHGDAPVSLPVTGDWPLVPRQLPSDITTFTGRAGSLKELDAALAAARPPHACAVLVVSGGPGAGKSALAVHWAHQVRDRFPAGQLWLDLHGRSVAPPRRPTDVLAAFLAALGVDADRIPPDEIARVGLYRSLLADRRVLIGLDDAADADQVRPLLPASAGSLVVVTSRDDMSGLTVSHDAHRVLIGELEPGEAVDLIERIIGVERARGEPAAVTELARLCGRLPLALRIAAATLTGQPELRVGNLAMELSSGDRLACLSVAGDAQVAVRVAIDHSYLRLTTPARGLLRLLATVPGVEFGAAAAAALAAVSVGTATRLLDQLAAAHLVERWGVRFRLHELIRLYAGDRAAAEESAAALAATRTRLFAFYLHNADAAVRLVNPGRLPGRAEPPPEGVPSLELRDHAAADAWLETERANLVAALRQAAVDGPVAFSWLLADRLRGYFRAHRYRDDWLATTRVGLAAAERTGDLGAQATMHRDLGAALQHVGEYQEAIAHYKAARRVHRENGDPLGQAVVAADLGATYSVTGRLDQALDCLEQALAVQREAGAVYDRATTLLTLGTVHRRRGDLSRAADVCRKALAACEVIDYRFGVVNGLNNLGAIQLERGCFTDARTLLRRALDADPGVGSRYFAPHALANLAVIERDIGDRDEALRLAEEAVRAAVEAGAGAPVQDAVLTLATVLHARGDTASAIEHYQRALWHARQDQDRYTEADTLGRLALAHADAGERALAIAHASSALLVARRAGYRVLEGTAQTALSVLHLRVGDHASAQHCLREAIRAAQQTGHRPGEARALHILGNVLHDRGNDDEARAMWQAAFVVHTELGTAEVAVLRGLPAA